MGKKKKKKFTDANSPIMDVEIDKNEEVINEEINEDLDKTLVELAIDYDSVVEEQLDDEDVLEDEITPLDKNENKVVSEISDYEEKITEKETENVEDADDILETNEDSNNEDADDSFLEDDKEKIEEELVYEEQNSEDELVYEEVKKVKKEKTGLMNTSLIILLLSSLIYFIMRLFFGSGDEAIMSLISSFILLIFTTLFVCIGFSVGKRKKILFVISSILLVVYFAFTVYSECFVNGGNNVLNFVGMSLGDVIDWSEENKIELIHDYEYSDMIDEYHIISQDVLAGTSIKDIHTITIAISEGPNPAKEVTVPSMLGWKSEDVLKFIKENHLTNVSVEFIESEDAEDTVIEQSKVGNVRRNEEMKLVFSAGEEIDYEEVKLIDFTGKSEFEVIFYLKQHHIRYEIKRDFSKKVKKGNAISQSIKAGTLVKINDEKIIVTISKGPEIKVIDLKGATVSEVTEWVVKNKLRVEFSDAYDDSIKENCVVGFNYDVGDTVEEGTVIKIILSKGKLVMPEFENISQFREWASTYEIEYEEKHEFSDKVDAGNIIDFSHKTNDTIKNDDTIVVTISDGKKVNVPSVIGMSKDDATNKLKNSGLGYNFVYSYSSSVEKGKAIKQSISAGSEVAKGTTVTVTLSNGPKPVTNTPSSGGSNNNPAPTPQCDTSKGATFWAGVGNTGQQVYNSTKSQNPGFTITANYVDSCPNGATTSGMVCSMNVTEGSFVSYCTTIKMTIVK